jgi:hypothetical protein
LALYYVEETVRSIVLAGARSCLVGLVIVALLNFPVTAATARPLGVVLSSENARLDNAGAVNGAAVYSGDALATDMGGSLRLQIARDSQVYLLSSTSATLVQQENKIQAKVDRGTLGFSMPAPGQLEIGTPLGIIRAANGQHVFGQVVVLSPTRMQVSAKEGTLVVAAANSPEKIIAPGETYEATLAESAESSDVGPQGVGSEGINWKRLAPVLIIGGGAAIAAGVIWHEMTESCSVPSSCD